MERIIQGAINRKKVTLFFVIFVAIMGFYSYYITPKQEEPEIVAPIAIVTAIYPGASSEEVEKLVTSKLEDKLTELKGFDYSESFSMNSVATVICRLVSDADVDKSWDSLRRNMQDVQKELPYECLPIDVNTDIADTAGMMISLSGDNYTYEQLSDYSEIFKKRFSRIAGVSKFEIIGKQNKEVKVEVNIAKLNNLSISMQDIVNVLKAQNLQIPSGGIDDGNIKINVKTQGMYTSLKEIENTIIDVSRETGAVLRLKDIADIHWGIEDSTSKIKHNGKNAVLLTGYFMKNKDILIIGKEVKKALSEIKKVIPSDVEVEEVLYQPDDVKQSIISFIINLIEGIVFVVIIVFLGMGWRNAVIVSTAIPISMLSTLWVMNFTGIQIHQISIASLIIALGMLVDNAIVVSDAIQARIDSDENKFDACVKGTGEVAIPVLTSTLTTVAAFVCLLLLPGVAGKYVSSIPLIIIISLSASYIVALFVTPVMAFLFLTRSKHTEQMHKTRKIFTQLLDKGLNNKRAVIVAITVAIAVAVYLQSLIGLQFFPKADKNIIYIDIKTEQVANLSKTEDIAQKVFEIIEQQKEVSYYTCAIGDGLPKFFATMSIPIKSKDSAQILVRLDLRKGKRFESNKQFVDYLQQIVDKEVAGGKIIVKELERGEPVGAPICIRVTGEDAERIGTVAEQIKILLNGIEGTANVRDDKNEKSYEFVVEINEDTATTLGITKYDVQREVSIALRGNTASVFRMEGNEYNITVHGNITSKEQLENIAIKSSVSDNKILLKQIANICIKPQIPAIRKYDRAFAVTVLSDVKHNTSPVKIEKMLDNKLKGIDLQGADIVYDGEKTKINQYFGDLGALAGFSILLIYVILLMQFNSIKQPFIILITVPLSVIGSVVGLLLFRQPLSFTALLGAVGLIGIVVNNAIVLIDFINCERMRGRTIKEACLHSVEKRFRPVMLTTITTVIGLIPLVFSKSNLFVPMSVALMSGLMISTMLTLIVIPVVYCMLEEKSEQRQNQKTMHTPFNLTE